MLKKLRIVFALIFFTGITLMLVDVTGLLHGWLGWMAKLQLLPAVLAGNVVVVAALLLATLLFGRIYCSVVCPLGVMQDLCSFFGGKVKKNRFHYSKNRPWLRGIVLALFVVLVIVGINVIAILIAPYSAYGRIATQLLAPLYRLGNNGLALLAERANSYLFYSVGVWVKAGATFTVAVITLVVIGFLSFRYGRVWCNTVCPVGTVLGFVSRFSLWRPFINEEKCVNCGKCAKNCKASCIDPEHHTIDYSRCVACMDCLENCAVKAISYQRKGFVSTSKDERLSEGVDASKRKFLTTTVAVGVGMAVMAETQKVDGGLAVIEDKQMPKRKVPVKPFGAVSLKHFGKHCTACQLCVSACPNHVLRPSKQLETLMQPEMSFEQGYCKVDCTRCGEVCPTGAIAKITAEEKTDRKIGHAIVVTKNCLSAKGESCGMCARKCPAAAISMITDNTIGHAVPTVNENRCIGCGACEYYCPSRPYAAIYIEGKN